MSKYSKKEYLEKMRQRYSQRSGKEGKSKLINEFCEVTGHERKYAIKLLRGNRRNDEKSPGRPGRTPIYQEAVIEVIKEIWLLSEQPCGKRLAPVLGLWLKAYKKRHGRLPYGVGKKVLSISPAQIDRVLARFKTTQSGRPIRPPRANATLKAMTPIRAESWDVSEPGWLEADTVAHCGGSMQGSFLWTLSITDIYSGWTEVRSVWNCGQYGICERFDQIENHLPFGIKGVDTDNGGEFLNWHFHEHFKKREPAVKLTRSRPYRKNDQAHIEQKNYTHVRQLLGYERMEDERLVAPVNELLEQWSLWHNLFCATMKQSEKKREAGRLIRRHERQPKPPCERLISYWNKQGQGKQVRKLKGQYKAYDPIEMKEGIEKRLKEINRLINQIQAEDKSEN